MSSLFLRSERCPCAPPGSPACIRPRRERLQAFVGQTRSVSLIAKLRRLGIGEMTVRGELPPRRRPYAYDNGAFSDWRHGRDFDQAAFERDVALLRRSHEKPIFLVLPDRVASSDSLALSLSWISRLRHIAPLALAVQDGMATRDVAKALRNRAITHLFVGGTLPWKHATASTWVRLAHAFGKRVHIGRVGTLGRVRWAREISADSIDSATPLWSQANLDRFIRALGEPFQWHLLGPVPPVTRAHSKRLNQPASGTP